jgi:hypothetical protein
VVALAIVATAGAVPPPVVAWQEAGTRVGQVVTVEGEVQSARIAGDSCILEFAADPAAFRAVLLLPLFGSGPEHPEQVYPGRRVRVTGRVQRFHGRPEVVLRGPGQVELVDAGSAAPPAEPPVSAPPPAPRSPGPAGDAGRARTAAAPCERARARWRELASDATARAAALQRCLEAMRYRCGDEGEALASAVTALRSIERQVDAACP